MATTLAQLLRTQAERYGDKDAFLFLSDGETAGTALSFAALDRRARALGVALRAHARHGDRVLLVVPPGLDYLVALCGCWQSGLVAVPVYPPDPHQPQPLQAVLARVAADAGVRAVVAPPALKPLLDGHVDGLPIVSPDAADATPNDALLDTVAPDDLAVLLYTSGSTGTPKGVMLSHGNLLSNAMAMSRGCRIDDRDTVCTWLPPYHSSGLFAGIMLPLFVGATNVTFSPLHFAARPARWLEAVARHRVTISGAPTFAYDVASQVPAHELAAIDLSSWRCAVVGGEPVRADALDRFARRYATQGFRAEAFYSMFGLTESTMITTGADPELLLPRVRVSRAGLGEHVAIAPQDEQDALELVGSGKALLDMDVAIVDPTTGTALGDDRIGEIWVAGPSVAKGYWNRPELTEATFRAHLAMAATPYLRTGDFGFVRAGELYVTGRLKEMIIIRGLNHYPEDLERTAMGAHPAPAGCACAAFGLPQNGEERLGLAVECPGGMGAENVAAIAAAMRAAIAQSHGVTVSAIALVPPGALPRTATRKVQRAACRDRVASGEWLTLTPALDALAAPVARLDRAAFERLAVEERPRAATAHVIQAIAQAIGEPPERLQATMPIAHTGLDSLAAVKLATTLARDFDCQLPIAHFFDGSTIAEVAALLVGDARAAAPAIDFEAEAQLSLPPVRPRTTPTVPVLLLTGATGYLGGYLLVQLLQAQPHDVACLARGDATARVLANVSGLPGWNPAWATRVRGVVGDLEKPGLGLTPADRAWLVESVTAIVHNGASVNFVSPYGALRGANVESVREVLTLARESGNAEVHFVSTVGVFNAAGRHRLARVREESWFTEPALLHGGYAQSKWVAERMLRHARAQGASVRLYRSGLIGAHSTSGHPHTDDFLCRLIKGCVELGAYPDLSFDLDVTPVDYVASAIAHLALAPAQGEGTYHLNNPQPIAFDAFLRLVAAAGYPMTPLPLDAWLQAIAGAPENALFPLLPFLTERPTAANLTFLELFTQGPCPGFDRRATDAGLAGSDVHCAAIDARLVNTYLDAWTRMGFLPNPAAVRV